MKGKERGRKGRKKMRGEEEDRNLEKRKERRGIYRLIG